jgi:molybdate transport system permease protein
VTLTRSAIGPPPLRLVLPALLGVTFLALPLLGLLLDAPWGRMLETLGREDLRQALWLSVLTSTWATVVVLVLGIPIAWLLARVQFRGRWLVRTLVVVPLVLPPVVAGVSLLSAFGRNGLFGGPLREAFGFSLPYTTAGVVVAHAFVAIPFFVLSVEGALRTTDEEYDAAAATLGASRWTTFRRIALPLAMPGVVAGLVLAWARSLGEFGATIAFAGSYPGTTRTMPLAVYTALQGDPEGALVLSVILLLVSVAVLALLRDHWFNGVVR